MRRPDSSEPWRLLVVDEGAAGASDLSPALRVGDATAADDGDAGDFTAGDVRRLIVDGIARDAMAQRIKTRLTETLDSAHLRHTRRAYMELQGRRRTPLPRGLPPSA